MSEKLLTERTFLRGVALQALYEKDQSDHTVGKVLTNRFEAFEYDPDAEDFIRKLVRGVFNHQEIIDREILTYAKDWPIQDIPAVDRNILRIAIFEFMIDGATPVEVAINESVELAKKFGSENSSRFVNGVLRSVAANFTKSAGLSN